ncbi:hypothetical protein KI387_012140, partial [Taxus chinensis]
MEVSVAIRHWGSQLLSRKISRICESIEPQSYFEGEELELMQTWCELVVAESDLKALKPSEGAVDSSNVGS